MLYRDRMPLDSRAPAKLDRRDMKYLSLLKTSTFEQLAFREYNIQ